MNENCKLRKYDVSIKP